MTGGDHLAPAFAVEINGVRVKADVSAAVTELSVTKEQDTIDHCSLTLANAMPEMRWTHDPRDADLFKEGGALKVELGYGHELQPMFDGEITAISPSLPETGTPTLRVEAYSRLHRLRGTPKTRSFVTMTDVDMARTIASDLKLGLDADATSVTHPYVLQFNQTDMAFLLERARRIRYRVEVDGRKLVFKKGGEAAAPTIKLAWGGGEGDVEPLRSFQPTLNALRPVDHVIVRGRDPRTGEAIEARAGAGEADASLGGRTTGPSAGKQAFGAREETIVHRPVASQEEAAALARAIFTSRALEFVTGTAATEGLPELTAGNVVQLEGLGRFNGRYYVTSSTHTMGAGGYLTSFSVRSDSLA
jgi:phage protein D